MSLAVLLRNCPHNATATDASNVRYALKCEDVSINITKTPIQIPIPQQSPELIDLGIFRPAITLSGRVDTVGAGNASVAGYENMEAITVSRRTWVYDGSGTAHSDYAYTNSNLYYYVPYKNKLEDAVVRWMATEDQELELEIGDANFPLYNEAAEPSAAATPDSTVSGTNTETGGALYVVAIQSCRFQQAAGEEDRYEFQMQFVAKSRADIIF